MNNLFKVIFLLLLSAMNFSCTEDSTTEPDTETEFIELIPKIDTDFNLSGVISTNVTIAANARVGLVGTTVMAPGTTLTIGAGAKILGDTDGDVSVLIIATNATINAIGTANNPIVFTSENAEGYRSPADWGGLVIAGNAPAKGANIASVEGDENYKHGGTDNADNSGTLRYVRIEFAGFKYDSETELNALGLFGVGSGTTIEYVQTHMGSDDGFEMFGGRVNLSYIVATANEDDQIDCADNYQGTIDYALAVAVKKSDSLIEFDGNGKTNSTANDSIVTVSHMTGLFDSAASGADYVTMWRQSGEYTLEDSYIAVTGSLSDTLLSVDRDGTELTVNTSKFEVSAAALTASQDFGVNEEKGFNRANIFPTQSTNIDDLGGRTATYTVDGATSYAGSISSFNVAPITDIRDLNNRTYTAAITGVTPTDTHLGAFNGTDWTLGWTAFPED